MLRRLIKRFVAVMLVALFFEGVRRVNAMLNVVQNLGSIVKQRRL
jgi:hypothetical protein